ncbi:MAG: hypothetical protein ACKVOR_05160, partial [Flavobacteriales bacterium]
MGKLLRSFAFVGEVSCWRKLRLSATKILPGLFFVFLSFGSANAQEFDCDPIIECPDDVTVECGTDIQDLSITGAVSVLEQGDCQYEIDWMDTYLPESTDCITLISRTFIVTAVDGGTATCTHLITVVDTTPPIIPGFVEALNFQCEEDVPEAGDCIAEDCNDVILCDDFTSCTGCDTLNCDLSLALGVGLDWSVWLAGLTSQGLASNDYYRWVPGTAFMNLNDDGTAHLWGEVVNVSNPNEGWTCHFWMENGRDWDDWSALGRSFKDDLGLGAPYHTFWTYYELVGGFSHLEGTGDNAGSWLSLSHMPSSYYFGFQCGQGANNRNANMGISGWFYYNGSIMQDGEETNVSGHGDVTSDKECGGNDVGVCETEFTRMYRAKDECG